MHKNGRVNFLSRLKETKVYSINDLYEWYKRDELVITPKYQRNPVWNMKAQSYLIDTIIRGLPIPQIFLRQSIDTNTRKTTREVIDGQQRLRAIIGFLNDDFSIMKLHNKEYGGIHFSELDEQDKLAFLDYQMPVELIKSKEDSLIYDMFSRVNTNSSTLNNQELRNAKYWGDFKVLVYQLSSKWRGFFEESSTFTGKGFIRMEDIEFVSSLLILTREGVVQDTPKKLDAYYAKYDEILPNSEDVENLFNNTMVIIENILSYDTLYEPSYFSKKNYMYTLFSYLLYKDRNLKDDEFITGIENIERQFEYDVVTLSFKIKEIESLISQSKMIDEKKLIVEKFVNLHKSRTTNEIERKERIVLFIKLLLSVG
jgi:hypothetical protein